MTFLAPLNFAFAALGGLIVLLYMLRLKRKEKVVSSTLLWPAAVRDLQANTPWQKLKSNALMWLQLAVLALAVLALARPAVVVFEAHGQTVAIILDASASMAATDVGPSRFENARAQAARLIDGLASGDRAMIIAASSQTRILASLTSDKKVLQRALGSAATEDTPCNMRDAIVLAASLLGHQGGTAGGAKAAQIYIYSDGALPPLQSISTGNAGLQFVVVGRGNNNLAVTALDIRRDYSAGGAYQIFATVRNLGKQPQTINLELAHEGTLMAVRPLTIGPGGRQSQLFSNGSFSSGLFSVGFSNRDDLQSDNIAYALLARPRVLRVLLVGSGNLFLEKALSVDPEVQLVRATAADYRGAAGQQPFDVVVCDGAAPADLPPCNQLLFHCFTALAPVEALAGVENAPSAVDWDRRHPVNRYTAWNDIHFASTQMVRLRPWGQSLVDAERTPLVVAGQRAGRRVVWCGFDVNETDLPLRVTFPIFIKNALHWLTSKEGGRAADDAGPLRAGDMVALDVPATAHQIDIADPAGRHRTIAVPATPLLYSGARLVGIYQASAGKWQQRFAVSLLDAAESDLQPHQALKMVGGDTIGGETHARANRDVWGLAALACLLLLCLEWWLYHRGI